MEKKRPLTCLLMEQKVNLSSQWEANRFKSGYNDVFQSLNWFISYVIHHVGIPFSDDSAVYCAGGWYVWCVSSTLCKQLLDQMQIKLKKNMTTWMMFSDGWDSVQYKRLKESKPGGRAIINKKVCCISLFTRTIWDNINLNVTSVDFSSANSTLCLLTLTRRGWFMGTFVFLAVNECFFDVYFSAVLHSSLLRPFNLRTLSKSRSSQ